MLKRHISLLAPICMTFAPGACGPSTPAEAADAFCSAVVDCYSQYYEDIPADYIAEIERSCKTELEREITDEGRDHGPACESALIDLYACYSDLSCEAEVIGCQQEDRDADAACD